MKIIETTILAASKVDRTNNIIHDVKVLGANSANRRYYPESTMRNALPKYEGSRVFIDHVDNPQKTRSYRDSFGTLVNPRVVKEADGQPAIYADMRFNPGHPLAEQLIHDAEHNPGSVGLSHSAVGKFSPKDGKMIETIDQLFSVDIVTKPATTNGLFEQKQETMDPITDTDTLKKAVQAILDNSELDLAGMAKALCDLADPLTGEPADQPAEVPAESKQEEAKQESKEEVKEPTQEQKLLEEIKSLKLELDKYKTAEAIADKKNKIEAKIKEAKLAPELVSEVFVQSLMEAKEEMVPGLIEDRKQIGKVKQKPVSKEQNANIVNESVEIKDSSDFCKRLLGK